MPHAEEKTVSTILNHHHPSSKVAYIGTASDKLRQYIPKPVEIVDIRSCPELFTVDKNGFQFVQRPTSCDFGDDEIIKDVYYKDCEALLKDVVGASNVLIAGHLVRNRTWEDARKAAENIREQEGGLGIVSHLHPAMTAHVDQSYKGAEQSLKLYYCEEEAADIMKGRWAIINLWRPLRPVNRDPLAVCDWRSVDEATDLAGVKGVLPGRRQHPTYGKAHDRPEAAEIERWELNYNDAHEWYYASNMQPDECFLIKCFDSNTDGTARCAPHSAFPTKNDSGPARESIELRCFVLWE